MKNIMPTYDAELDNRCASVAISLKRSIRLLCEVGPIGRYVSAVRPRLMLENLHIIGLTVFAGIYPFSGRVTAVACSWGDHCPLPCIKAGFTDLAMSFHQLIRLAEFGGPFLGSVRTVANPVARLWRHLDFRLNLLGHEHRDHLDKPCPLVDS